MSKGDMVECSVFNSKLVSKAYTSLTSKQRALKILLVSGDCILVGLQRLSQRGNSDGTPSEVNCNGTNMVFCGELKLQKWETWGFIGILSGLTVYMILRTLATTWRGLIGQGPFRSVHLRRLSDGKLFAVKVRSYETQPCADSFVNDVS